MVKELRFEVVVQPVRQDVLANGCLRVVLWGDVDAKSSIR